VRQYADELRRARLAAGLSQARVADAARLSQRTVSRFEAGLRREHQKQLDGGVDLLVLLVANTKHNRAVLRDAGQLVTVAFPLGPRAVLASLGRGEAPPASGVVIL
jgi:Helix-turn-helix domain